MDWLDNFGIFILHLGLLVRANLVTIKQGTLMGTTMNSSHGRTFSAYLGIPYAQPPIGNLRFKPPVAALPWEGVFNASEIPIPCVQCKEGLNITFGHEDCLNLNVYTPLNAKPGDNFPVIMYVFGGIHKQGTNIQNGPQFFMNKDIIIVMPNYRLGPLGFLSTGDDVISGNMGLKDQLLALKWIRENIFVFGGDVNRVTLQGHSSGAICVHLHTLSPLSKGLFNRVIIQSGSSFSGLGFFDRDVSRSVTKELATRVGCPALPSEELLKCLTSIKGETFLLTQYEMSSWIWRPDALFRPTVEIESAKDAFITEIPINISYQSTDLEWMIGITTGDGNTCTMNALKDEAIRDMNANYTTVFPPTLQYLWNTKPKDRDFISASIRKHYFHDERIDFKLTSHILQMYTQGQYGSSVNEALRRYGGTKYVYLFDYFSQYSIHNQMSNYGCIYGVFHADEVLILFFDGKKSIYLLPQDLIFGQEMITRWINFAHSGNPNTPYAVNESIFASWDPVKTKSIEYLHIKTNGKMENDFYTSEYKFWRRLPLFSKYF